MHQKVLRRDQLLLTEPEVHATGQRFLGLVFFLTRFKFFDIRDDGAWLASKLLRCLEKLNL